MLNGYNIICISSIDWNYLWQAPQEIMSRFSSKNKILYVENTGYRTMRFRDYPKIFSRLRNILNSLRGKKKEIDSVEIYSPFIIPINYFLFNLINEYLVLRKIKKNIRNKARIIVWIFLPNNISVKLINHIGYDILVYYCLADFSELSSLNPLLKKSEKKILKEADIILAQNKEIIADDYNRYKQKTVILNPGVNAEKLLATMKTLPKLKPEELLGVLPPIIGYSGALHDQFDSNLVEFLAKKNNDLSFVFIGPLQINVDKLKRLPNVCFIEKQPYDRLAYYLQFIDIGIIPYKLNRFTKSVFPIKIYDYLALGKNIVSTSLPEVMNFKKKRNYKNIFIADDYIAFNNNLRKIIQNKKIQKKIIIKNEDQWSFKFNTINALLERNLNKKNEWTNISCRNRL